MSGNLSTVNEPTKSLIYSVSSLFAIVTTCCIYKDIKFTRLLISINLALYATPNLLPARRCRTISNEKPNNEAEELSENDLKFANVKTYLHIAVMLKILSKDLKRLPRVVQTISVLSKSGFIHRIVPKNTYILGSEAVFSCNLQGPSTAHRALRWWRTLTCEQHFQCEKIRLFGRDLTLYY